MKHILIRDPLLQGWEYGMLRAFEDVIVRQTGATVIELPLNNSGLLSSKLQHGMRLDSMRKFVAKKEISIDADVIWCILMGPENYRLDLFKGWESVKHRILYLFDTLPVQYPLIARLFSGTGFTERITSFNDARLDLERLTKKRWNVIEQAGAADLFSPVSIEQKLIHFSSYGRRWAPFHEAILNFCAEKDLYYDYTTFKNASPAASPDELYKQYAWHLNHSLFTISWPVELTNPKRAGHLHPVTCRWFEAACAGTIVLGAKPANGEFDNMVFKDLIVELNPHAEQKEIKLQLEEIWEKRAELYESNHKMQMKYYSRLTWENRVQRILQLLES